MKACPILIDCDTGTDDAIAIIEAFYSPLVDLRALTTVAGNVALEFTSQNTLDLVEYLGFKTKVSVGAAVPIMDHTIHHSDNTHGSTGLGSVTLPKASSQFYEKNACETILEAAKEAKGELVVVPIGPMTNIAHAVMVYPELKTLINRIVFMGGAMYRGNMTTTSEFNAWYDPEALSIVLHSGIPCVMIGLDVTEKAVLDQTDADFFRQLNTRAGTVTADLLDFMIARTKQGGEAPLMHDGLALAVAVDPEIVTTKAYYVDCECSGTYTRGHTFVATNDVVVNRAERPINCEVAVDLDMARFRKFIRETIALSQKAEAK